MRLRVQESAVQCPLTRIVSLYPVHDFKPKTTAAASRGFLTTARLSCLNKQGSFVTGVLSTASTANSIIVPFVLVFKTAPLLFQP